MSDVLAYVGDGYMMCPVCYDNQPRDEQEALEPIYEESECRTDDGTPHSCDTCLGYVADVDDSYNVHPLARSISQLTIACGDSELTRALSEAHHIALDFETSPKTLTTFMQRWADAARVTLQGAYGDTIDEALNLTAKWCETWNTREVVTLYATPDGGYVDAAGEPYQYQNTFGYLDVLEGDCDGCGRCLFNEGYFGDCDARCADCVNLSDEKAPQTRDARGRFKRR